MDLFTRIHHSTFRWIQIVCLLRKPQDLEMHYQLISCPSPFILLMNQVSWHCFENFTEAHHPADKLLAAFYQALEMKMSLLRDQGV